VSSALAIMILALLTSILLALPLLPAIDELRRKRDALPLNVIQQYSGDIRHFANGFRNYIDGLQQSLRECVALGKNMTGQLRDGDEYLLLGQGDAGSVSSLGKIEDRTCPLVIIAGSDTVLPGDLTFAKEIYAAGRLLGGEGNTYRAILGEKDVHILRGGTVLRWAHAVGPFRADHDCDLYGRISSDREIDLQAGCRFRRLNAPRITMQFADETGGDDPNAFSDRRMNSMREHPLARRLIEGDLGIEPGEVITENVVVRGKLLIGAGARVLGNVKSHQHMFVDAGVVVEGSLISASTMHLGPRCRVFGPVLAEHAIGIESGTQCGSPESPTTVNAPIIDIEEGSVVFGTLWARAEGRVVPRI
jgi:cytoskeletal protein CcmA (bactofilin family)